MAVIIPSGLSVVAILTNSSHRLFLPGFGHEFLSHVGKLASAGPLFWISLGWSLVLLAGGIGLYLASAYRLVMNKQLVRGLALGTAALVPPLLGGALTTGDVDFTPMGLFVSVSLLFLLNWRYRILDTLPVARRHVIEHLTDGVVVADLSGRIFDLNPATERMLETPASRLLRRTIWSAMAEVAVGGKEAYVEDLVSGLIAGGSAILEEFQTRSGRTIEVSADSVRGGDGTLVGLCAVLRDRTRRRLYEHFIRQTQRLETAAGLAAGIAHEVNNPLAYVRSNLSHIDRAIDGLSTEKPDEIEELRTVIGESIDGIERVSEIVDRMRRFASLSEGEFRVLDVNAVAGEALEMATLHPLAGVELHSDPGDALPKIQGSSEHLIHALLNLIVNAVQAVSQQGDGTVRVTTRARDGSVEIRVSDNGPGIPAAIRNRIFDPFFTTRAPGEGSGLGLAIAYDIIREHRGVLEFQSQEGQGAEFTIRLPASPGI
jgi:PAS domain S-box-containing protein